MTFFSIKTPSPNFEIKYEFNSNQPDISIAVSLYNYKNIIIETLDTIFSQTFNSIELLIVDDSSNDSGGDLVHSWLEKYGNRFARACLIQHETNGGLAAARNTAFSQANSDWVWVQDADNPLSVRALEHCYSIAKNVHKQVAVVHPLLLTIPFEASPNIYQGEGKIWQKSNFKFSNSVDAMALVRRSAWEEIGGYVHIPGGWEDYDFWCSLIENGFTGVQCPEVMGCYRYHEKSMTTQTVLPNVKKLEELMQHRHPWIECVGNTER